jgi:hypothetical protein
MLQIQRLCCQLVMEWILLRVQSGLGQAGVFLAGIETHPTSVDFQGVKDLAQAAALAGVDNILG